MKYYYDNDAPIEILHDKTIGIIGYGNQGKAHALNLKESGLDVIVGLRDKSPNRKIARDEGLTVESVETTTERADYIMLLIPDELQPEVYAQSIKPFLAKDNILGFAHGFCIHFGYIKPPETIDVVLNSPKCIGYLVRETFRNGFGFPNLVAIHQDASGKALQYALAYARGIGGTRAGVMDSTVEEETVTNLFGEQSVLCGGIVELIKAAFDTLVQAGYQPEIVFFECLHEIKPIIDLFYKEGLGEMNRRISNTAEYGEYLSGPRVVGERSRETMQSVLRDIRDGTFAKRWIDEHNSGLKMFNALRNVSQVHPIEEVSKEMRKKMPWLREKF